MCTIIIPIGDYCAVKMERLKHQGYRGLIMRKTTAIFFAIIVMISFIFGMMANTTVVNADEITDLEAKIKSLSDQKKKLDVDIKNIDGLIDNEEEAQQMLKERIDNTTQQIALYEKKIASMESDIVLKEGEIAEKSSDIFDNEELFSQRVRSMYVASTGSTLSYVLSAKSFSELLTRSEILRRISESDSKLIENLREDRLLLDTIKVDMEGRNVALKATKEKLASSAAELASDKKKSESNQESLLARQSKYMQQKKDSEKEIKANEAAIDKILKARASQGTAPEGQYKWPVPSSSRITSPYGWRTWAGKKEMHWGVDIGAKAGTDIVAAHDGTVIIVNKFSYGYGWHVIVDHGGGHATLYAHASRIDVKAGDVVKRGQVIAGIGTTGASSGNHLHFEVRINAVKKDPMGYVVAGS